MRAEQLERSAQANLRDLLDARGAAPPLEPDHIHVWRLSTEIAPRDLNALEALLSAGEKARAARFHYERDRRRFTACRGCLRLLAAAYSGQKAEHIDFRYGHQGKPALSGSASSGEKRKAPGGMDLRFNVSHSGELALLAFSIGREVGVDVELMRTDIDFLALAQSSFSPAEQQALAALPPQNRAALFYEYWSCKEACIKADGRGISAGLEQFGIVPSQQPGWRGVASQPGCVSPEMRLQILKVGAGYAAAVAVPLSGWDAALIHIL